VGGGGVRGERLCQMGLEGGGGGREEEKGALSVGYDWLASRLTRSTSSTRCPPFSVAQVCLTASLVWQGGNRRGKAVIARAQTPKVQKQQLGEPVRTRCRSNAAVSVGGGGRNNLRPHDCWSFQKMKCWAVACDLCRPCQ